MIRPGEQVHFAALLDEHGETITTIPFDVPLECPEGAQSVRVSLKVDLELRASGVRRDA